VQASGDGAPVNEDPIATNLRNPNQLLTGGNDFSCPNTLGFYASNDGGSTWTHTCFPGTNGEGDSIVGYDLNNVAYAGGVENSSVFLSASTDNGQTWSTPKLVTGPTFGYLADKPWLEIDTNPSSPFKNALYVSVTQLDPNTDSQITVSHSNDGGKTWTTRNVAPMQTFPNDVDQFTDLAVGADGTVYVSWLRCPAVSGECAGQVSQLLLSKSSDGGNTWSSPVTIANPTLAPASASATFPSMQSSARATRRRCMSPSIAGADRRYRCFSPRPPMAAPASLPRFASATPTTETSFFPGSTSLPMAQSGLLGSTAATTPAI
jgi:Neuraminidase (sialidase)